MWTDYMETMKELGPLMRFILSGVRSRCSIKNTDGEKKSTLEFQTTMTSPIFYLLGGG